MKNKEIAELIGKTPSAVSYTKRNNSTLFEVIKLGAMCFKHGISANDLEYVIKLKEVIGGKK